MSSSPDTLILLGGATGSGKTALAIALARIYPELVVLSADSRQVYKKLDVGTAKVGAAGVSKVLTGKAEPVWFEQEVPQYLIDLVDPEQPFSLVDYQREAYRLIRACWDQGKVPLVVGGTGLYLQALAEGYVPEGAPDTVLRQELEQLSVCELQARLAALSSTIAESDAQNKRRLIRAIELAKSGRVAVKKEPITTHVTTYALTHAWSEQRSFAPAMVKERLDLGLVEETRSLLAGGIDKSWLMGMGLSYRLVIRFLDGEFSESELEQKMIDQFRQLMRRQRTWFNRMPQAMQADKTMIMAGVKQLLGR